MGPLPKVDRAYFIICNNNVTAIETYKKTATNNYFDVLFELPLSELPNLPEATRIELLFYND